MVVMTVMMVMMMMMLVLYGFTRLLCDQPPQGRQQAAEAAALEPHAPPGAGLQEGSGEDLDALDEEADPEDWGMPARHAEVEHAEALCVANGRALNFGSDESASLLRISANSRAAASVLV